MFKNIEWWFLFRIGMNQFDVYHQVDKVSPSYFFGCKRIEQCGDIQQWPQCVLDLPVSFPYELYVDRIQILLLFYRTLFNLIIGVNECIDKTCAGIVFSFVKQNMLCTSCHSGGMPSFAIHVMQKYKCFEPTTDTIMMIKCCIVLINLG